MDIARLDGFTQRTFKDTADSFIASTVPSMLVPLTTLIHNMHPGVMRTGIFLSNEDGTRLHTWVDSDGRVVPCPEELSNVPADSILAASRTAHARETEVGCADPQLEWAGEGKTQALAVFPVGSARNLVGYMVVEASPRAADTGSVKRELIGWGPLAATVLQNKVKAMRMLVGTVRFARDFTLMRDRETGEHQLRLGAYLHVLADEMRRAHGLSDGFADEVTLFGPLHDVGKIGIADDVLLKPGTFDPFEWEQMKEHVSKGRELIQQMTDDLGLDGTPGLDTLKAVVAHHHEYLDGSGYPEGRSAEDIPLAARLVTIADIFDALTCVRPYKRSWSVDEAYTHLAGLAGEKIDAECYAALCSARGRITDAWRTTSSADEPA